MTEPDEISTKATVQGIGPSIAVLVPTYNNRSTSMPCSAERPHTAFPSW